MYTLACTNVDICVRIHILNNSKHPDTLNSKQDLSKY